MTKTWRCYLIKVCGSSWVIRTGFLERCCSDVSLTSSCSTMEWRQTSEQLIAPELAPQQSINSTTEEKVVLCIWLADCPFNFIITLCCCTLTFQPHDFLSVGVTNLKRLCVNATAGRRLSAVVGCLRWSAALQFWFSRFSSLWTFDFMFQLCHAILSKTYMPWRAEFSKAFSTENSRCYETMKLWNFGTVTVIQPDTDAAAPLQSSCQLSAEPSTVSCWPADCKHRLENGDLGCFKQCADFPLKWEVVFL